MKKQLQQLLEQAVRPGTGAVLRLHAPFMNLEWEGAAGTYCAETAVPMRPDHGFRIASMSKTFTGVLAMQFLEQGLLDLDASIEHYLGSELFLKIPVLPGHAARDITPRMLLQHRAGFNDFALSQAWMQVLIGDPGRYRSPQEIIDWALANAELVGAPGENYCYSDTGYVLLGLLLEQLSGSSYAQLCRERILAPCDMHSTWLEGHEEPHSDLAHCYVMHGGQLIDALQIHGSADWAAGGHVSSTADLNRFLRALFSGRLFAQTDTLDTFLCGPRAGERFDYHYCMGVGRKVIRGKHLWGHLGHWGSFMYYCPEERLALSGTLGHDQPVQNDLLDALLALLYPAA
jgi:D-alanyl-D-alanine carboxypeptidase